MSGFGGGGAVVYIISNQQEQSATGLCQIYKTSLVAIDQTLPWYHYRYYVSQCQYKKLNIRLLQTFTSDEY